LVEDFSLGWLGRYGLAAHGSVKDYKIKLEEGGYYYFNGEISMTPLSLDASNYKVTLKSGRYFYLSGTMSNISDLIGLLGFFKRKPERQMRTANSFNFEKKFEARLQTPIGCWKSIFFSALAINLAAIGFALYMPWYFVITEWSKFLPIAGVFSCLVSIPFIRKFRNTEKISLTELEMGNPPSEEKITEEMYTGLGFAELPSLCGIIYYLFSGEILWMAVLCLLTMIILYLYKPIGQRADKRY